MLQGKIVFAAALLIGIPPPDNRLRMVDAFVAREGTSLYLFPTRAARREYDLRTCTTAVAPVTSEFKKLVVAAKRKRPVSLTVRVYRDYFSNPGWSYYFVGHEKFGNIPLSGVCESRDLYEIIRSR
jgi:hypothetical protein